MLRTCGHPDCTVRFADCEIHHVIEWIHQHGPTDLANLLPLCREHYHRVHDAGWHLTLHPDRTITLRRLDDTVRATTAPASTSPSPASSPHPTTPDQPDEHDEPDASTAALARVAERFTLAA